MINNAPDIPVLTIAGTDPSGGAGIQADLKTFTAHGCYGTSVVTALVAQNTTGVQDVQACSPAFVAQQVCTLRSVLEDIGIKALKTGMLFDASTVRVVASTLREHFQGVIPPLVCDPVCVSTSGHTLLLPEAVDDMITELFPLATLITPNKSEAELILSTRKLPSTINNLADMLSASQDLLTLGPKAVLLKGGHITASVEDVAQIAAEHPEMCIIRSGLLEENMEILEVSEKSEIVSPRQVVVDVLKDDENLTLFIRPRIDSTSTHGTGCTLSAAITCALSRGVSVAEATQLGTTYTHLGIETASPIGKGHGPLNHMHSMVIRSIPRPTPSVPHPFTRSLIKCTSKLWKEYVEHDFVKQLARGTLQRECFVHFIKQDYLYLRYYARAYGLLAAKSATFSAIDNATKTIINVLTEVNTHRSFCARWGISEEELQATPESSATTAYGAYIIDVGFHGDASKLLMAVAACLLGYGEVGLWLKKEASKPNTWVRMENNPYGQWIEDYSGEHYQSAVRIGIETIEAMAVQDPPSPARLKEWCSVWERCTRLEKGFWDMAMGLL